MNERYRWNDETPRGPEERRDLEERAARGWRGEDYGRGDGAGWRGGEGSDRRHDREDFRPGEGRSYYGLGDRMRQAERDAPNSAWDNKPGGPYVHDRETGRGQENWAAHDPQNYSSWRGGAQDGAWRSGGRGRSGYEGSYGSHGGGQYGGYGGHGQRSGQYDPDYSHSAYGRPGPRYAEGGYESRRPHDHDYDHRRRDEEERSWWRKARDEFNAWLGDREAEERRRHDHHHQRHEPGRTAYGSQMRDDVRSPDDDTAWRDPISRSDVPYRPRVDRNDGWREEGERRHEPRDHRPGWFRDDR